MKTFIRILSLAKPYWKLLILGVLASIFYGVFNASSLWIVGTLIGTIMGTVSISENPNHKFCIGVQWHPEFLIDRKDIEIFKALVESSR